MGRFNFPVPDPADYSTEERYQEAMDIYEDAESAYIDEYLEEWREKHNQ